MKPYSLASYRGLLELALAEGWNFRGFTDEFDGVERVLLLRHDVDFSVDLALEMAKVNAEVGVSGTFFLLLRANLYNLMAPRNIDRVKAMVALGQRVGLHFAAFEPVPERESEVFVAVEREMDQLRNEIPQLQPVVAWHSPTTPWLSRYAEAKLPGLVNVYNAAFIKDMCYRSDSNLRNSVEQFEAVLRDPAVRRLHLLFHPLNWAAGGRDMMEILGGTWRQIIREREEEFLGNRAYAAAFPQGMPAEVVEQFVVSLSAAAVRKAA